MTVVASLDEVRAAAGPDAGRPAASYAIEGQLPALAVRPATREAVARVLAAATRVGAAVAPQGGRTALRLGHPLEGYDVALDLGRLDRVVAYEPADLTVTVEAGVTLATLQARLGEEGQYLPVDPPPGDEVSVGGLLATARAGAWRGHAPNQRELILGATVALAEGVLATSGGRVVKNVSGYDLHRLHTGALGTLGVLVEASFKVAPLPAATCALALRVPTLAGAEALAFDAWNFGLPLRALTILTPEAAASAGLTSTVHVLIEVAGSAPAVERSVRELERTARDAAAVVVDGAPEVAIRLRRLAGGNDALDDTVLRLGVPPTEVRAALEAARRLVPGGVA
jgi:glycolate oxidase FAD binding subunit